MAQKSWPGKPSPEQLEKYLTWLDGGRLWLSKAFRIGARMVQGAYLLDERRRLLVRLGERAYSKMQAGEWKEPELMSLVHQVERLGKKIELEEQLIRDLRFGSGDKPPSPEGGPTDTVG